MSTFAVEFLGCKVSLADAQSVRERLAGDGHDEVDAPAARVRVVNTCCVTAEAVAKSRKAVRRAARTADRVLVTGCAANLRDAGLDVAPNVTVLPVRSERLPEAAAGVVGDLGCTGGAAPPFARTRAYVKVQDGCSFACTYCVIPQVRGASRSRAAEAVLAEVARRAAQGHREVVLTGINLGCFRDRAAGMRLADLLVAVAEVPGIERVRLSSIEVNHLTDALLDALSHPRVAAHLHVPMQSGDDGVLRAMRRHYSAATFLAAMRRARARVAGVNLTTDALVGHPAETEAAFAATLRTVEEAGFTKVHVFPYSPRPGTTDGDRPGVAAAAKRRRCARLREFSDARGDAHRAAKRGHRERILVESGDGHGHADDMTAFVVAGAAPGTLVDVVAAGVEGDAVVGVPA
ncbi:MAG TPA: MiaB/RimO family radical SAM methylthiotransferase [Gaiellales bacterium]|jgi:threonylcarbamoyladenosine tRNA methylthiotransferase MtaB|nr:MiaB/RimO family radical SAM methylthiotransferase [Gaiellales bacterium]